MLGYVSYVRGTFMTAGRMFVFHAKYHFLIGMNYCETNLTEHTLSFETDKCYVWQKDIYILDLDFDVLGIFGTSETIQMELKTKTSFKKANEGVHIKNRI